MHSWNQTSGRANFFSSEAMTANFNRSPINNSHTYINNYFEKMNDSKIIIV